MLGMFFITASTLRVLEFKIQSERWKPLVFSLREKNICPSKIELTYQTKFEPDKNSATTLPERHIYIRFIFTNLFRYEMCWEGRIKGQSDHGFYYWVEIRHRDCCTKMMKANVIALWTRVRKKKSSHTTETIIISNLSIARKFFHWREPWYLGKAMKNVDLGDTAFLDFKTDSAQVLL